MVDQPHLAPRSANPLLALARRLSRLDPRQALAHVEEVTGHLEHLTDPAERARLELACAELRGMCHYWLGDCAAARRFWEDAHAGFAAGNDWRGLAAYHGYLAYIESETGDVLRGLEAARLGLEFAERSGDRATLAEALNIAGALHSEAGLLAESFELLGRGLRLADEIGDRVCGMRCRGNLAHAYAQMGQIDDAIATFRELLAIADALDYPRDQFKTHTNLAAMHRQQGRLDEAMAHFARAKQVQARGADSTERAALLLEEAKTYLQLAQPAEARRNLAAVLELARQENRPGVEAGALVELATLYEKFPAHAPAGHPALEAVIATLDAAHRCAGRNNAPETLALVHRGLARAYTAAGRLAEAVRHHELLAQVTQAQLGAEAARTAARLKLRHELEQIRRDAAAQRQRADELALLNAQIETQRAALAALHVELEDKVRALKQEIAARQETENEKLMLERQVFEAQKIESLGVLAGGIAHDFNNLLTVIMGHASMHAGGPPPIGHAMQQIQLATQNAARLCRQMLDFAGHSLAHKLTVDPAAVLRDAAALAGPTMPGHCRLTLQLPEALPAVLGDPGQLRQVVTHLIINAAEAIGDAEGEIVVSGAALDLDAAELGRLRGASGAAPGRYVTLEVHDNGIGISDELQARIFEPFFSTKFTGRGLGLSSALGIVRAHGGRVGVASAPRAGAHFRVFLPALAATPSAPVAARDLRKWRGSGVLLVIDDDERVREVAGLLAQRLGFEVLTAADGIAGLALYEQHAARITAVLLDYKMPHLDGGEVLRRLRAFDLRLPVVMMSGFTEREATGVFGSEEVVFLQKPFTPATLREKLAAVLPGGSGGASAN